MNAFLNDVLKGLTSSPKYLNSKYFYDKKGDELFQKIMETDEYYLTNAEMEIVSKQTSQIVDKIIEESPTADVVEFGPGDAIKSVYLLKELSTRKALKNYLPIDISENIIHLLDKNLPKKIPGISILGFVGEYLEMLAETCKLPRERKLVLFLGANIGNFKFPEMFQFFNRLKSLLSENDLLLVGFDLKKDPKKILAAYNDQNGYTSEFNLNLLRRINKDLDANFQINNFEHYATYDPETGACKSFLISTRPQSVRIKNTLIQFEKYESVFMEISQKYSVSQINEIAANSGFEVLQHYFDHNNYFVDVLLKCKK